MALLRLVALLPKYLSAAVSRRAGVSFALGLLCASLVTVGSLDAPVAVAAEGPVWQISSLSTPTNLPPGSTKAAIVVTATNIGAGASSTNISLPTIEDTLPEGLTATAVIGTDSYSARSAAPELGERMICYSPPTVTCLDPRPVDPGDVLTVRITVEVSPSGLPPSVVNHANISGGGANAATVDSRISVGGSTAPPGIVSGSALVATSSSQAGAHANLTTAFALSTVKPFETAVDVRDVRSDLPVGLVGNTVGMPRCSMSKVLLQVRDPNACPRDTMVGIASLMLDEGDGAEGILPLSTPVYNIAPAPGEPAAFAFDAYVFPVRLDTSVLSDGNYGIRVTVPEISEAAITLATSVTIWGVPADHSGPGVNGETNIFGESWGAPNPGQTRVPLLTNPQQCSAPTTATIATDSWSDPGVFQSLPVPTDTFSGCGELSLDSSFSMLPDTLQAGAPAGYTLNLQIPQDTDPDGLATPNVRKVVTKLPLGTVISPSAATGLSACSSEQFFGPGPREQRSASPGECPANSQVGTVSITTPALVLPLTGAVYLAQPECGPCTPSDAASGRMVRLFVQVVGKGESGIVVKLEGRAQINQQTGQVTATFEENPQLPFNEFELKLGGGERATLANPRTCGPASTSLELTPWSAPFTADSTSFSTFEVGGCPGARFAPSFVTGTTSNQAGGFSPLTLSFGRSDSDEYLNRLQLRMPPGLLGVVSSVPLCGEPQAAQGTCPAASLIGHTNVETGPGADPFLVEGGQVFLTGPYAGAPYGLSIIVPAQAGPYTLSGSTGNGTVVVRAAIAVDPNTAALTVTSDPLPRMLDGIPLQLRLVNVTIDRPNFIFNPTDCNPLSSTGILSSSEGMSATIASHFQVTDCAALHFKPSFTVSTSGHTSRKDGASLDAKVVYPAGAFGSQANIASVKVDLPKQLPSRLSTLQKACPAATFEANPAICPAASVVGVARAKTPVLPVELTGPVYFVSHGGEAFPSLIVILQGDGVRVDLTGSTFISKAGITSSTFRTVPDVPIDSFELYLPEGPHSALAATGNLCKSKLAMPTAFVAQNGAQIKQSTNIAVSGCSRVESARATKRDKKAPRVSRRRTHDGKVSDAHAGGKR
jgi:hypothetical protein